MAVAAPKEVEAVPPAPKEEPQQQKPKDEEAVEEAASAEKEEIKEVRSIAEEIPPPLPTSNPPSPVTVFAESTKADVDNAVVTTSSSSSSSPSPIVASEIVDSVPEIPEKVEQNETTPVVPVESAPAQEPLVVSEPAPHSPPVVADSRDELAAVETELSQSEILSVPSDPELLPSQSPPEIPESIPSYPDLPSPVLSERTPPKESNDSGAAAVTAAADVQGVITATVTDSLPDISTESLPSLPAETVTGDSLPPMSLPPVESIPDALIGDDLPPAPPSPVSDIPLPPTSDETIVLTNGKTNGLASPSPDDVSLPPPVEGPLKQVNN